MRRRVSDHSAELSRHGPSCARMTCAGVVVCGSSQHTLMATCFPRVILVVSYIGPYIELDVS